VEDIRHFVLDCPTYSHLRLRLFRSVSNALANSSSMDDSKSPFGDLPDSRKFGILLGKRGGDPWTDNKIDCMVKRYLVKCWNKRQPITDAINKVLGTSYGCLNYSTAEAA
jgi:hypothetical protein